MQTFLPYPDFHQSAMILDRRRLCKQRVEAMQLINAINAIKKNDLYIIDKNGRRRKRGWLSHPATLIWFNYKEALKLYHNVMIKEWISQGYVNNMKLYKIDQKKLVLPHWLGDKKFHDSHKSNLLRKDKSFYSENNWDVPDNLEYFWPI